MARPIRTGDPGYRWAASRLDKADKALILGACDEAKARGATSKQLAALYALVFINNDEPDSETRAVVQGWGLKHLPLQGKAPRCMSTRERCHPPRNREIAQPV